MKEPCGSVLFLISLFPSVYIYSVCSRNMSSHHCSLLCPHVSEILQRHVWDGMRAFFDLYIRDALNQVWDSCLQKLHGWNSEGNWQKPNDGPCCQLCLCLQGQFKEILFEFVRVARCYVIRHRVNIPHSFTWLKFKQRLRAQPHLRLSAVIQGSSVMSSFLLSSFSVC